jgi:hypothetical protein
MSETTIRPVAPYQPAEQVFNTRIPEEYRGRYFLCHSSEGWWVAGDDNGSYASGYCENRDEAFAFTWEVACSWPTGRRTVEMLPIAPAIPSAPTAAERDIKWGELGKLGANRLCLIKDAEGKYLDGNLQVVMSREVAPVQKCSTMFGLALVKQYTFELLVPADADTGGPEMQEVICYAEAMRQDDTKRFLVKWVKPNEVSGYAYAMSARLMVCRGSAQLYDKKELRRYFDDVPKAEVIIELLKPQPISKMNDFFNEQAVALIKASPNNELVRGFMLSKLKVMPPTEADTYEKLEHWICWNVSNKPAVKPSRPVEEPIIPTTPTIADIELEIELHRSRIEYGRCDFRRNAGGVDTVPLTVAELSNLAATSNSWANFRSRVKNHASSKEDNCDYDEEEDSRHSEYEVTDSDGHCSEFNSVSATDAALKTFMEQYLPTELQRLVPPTTPAEPLEALDDINPEAA